MKLADIRNNLAEDILGEGYHLFDLTYNRKEKILTCLIDESLDLDTISALSEKISSFMDKYDDEFDEYLLDVSCVGAERPIRNEEEVVKAIGSYVHVATRDFKADGILKAYSDGKVTLEYQDKNKSKVTDIEYSSVKQMRYAVKF